jgi:hypothetical protein
LDPGFLEHPRLSPRAVIGPGARFLDEQVSFFLVGCQQPTCMVAVVAGARRRQASSCHSMGYRPCRCGDREPAASVAQFRRGMYAVVAVCDIAAAHAVRTAHALESGAHIVESGAHIVGHFVVLAVKRNFVQPSACGARNPPAKGNPRIQRQSLKKFSFDFRDGCTADTRLSDVVIVSHHKTSLLYRLKPLYPSAPVGLSHINVALGIDG